MLANNAEEILMSALLHVEDKTKQDFVNAITTALGREYINVTETAIDRIPKVKIVDESGHVVNSGYYFRYPENTGYPIGFNKTKYIEGVVTYVTGDWGMPCCPQLSIVTPPRRIVI